MTEDLNLPSFPDQEPPVEAPKPPRKPRRKPTKKRKARVLVVTRPQPKKKRGKKRAGISKKVDRRTKAFRQKRTTNALIFAETAEMGKARTSKAVPALTRDPLDDNAVADAVVRMHDLLKPLSMAARHHVLSVLKGLLA